MMHRLFAAARPPEPVRRHLLGLMGGVAGARWQGDDQLHITLRFIGEVDGRMAEDVAAALLSVSYPRFETALGGIGTFGRKGRIETLWAALSPPDGLAALHRKIDQLLVRLGLPAEGRAYLPHVTLARFGGRGGNIAGFAALNAGLSSPAFTVDSFGLYESSLGRDGARYTLRVQYPLG